jgi:hypothetical protein
VSDTDWADGQTCPGITGRGRGGRVRRWFCRCVQTSLEAIGSLLPASHRAMALRRDLTVSTLSEEGETSVWLRCRAPSTATGPCSS